MAKKYSGKKKFLTALCLTAVGVGLFFGGKAIYNKINSNPNPNPNPVNPVNPVNPDKPVTPVTPVEKQALENPVPTYNQVTNKLFWEPIPNASKYSLTVNGNTIETKETEHDLEIEEKSNYEISVQALGDDIKFTDSKIATLTGYRQDQNFVIYQKINENLKIILDGYMYGRQRFDLQNIFNVEIKDDKLSVLCEYLIENYPNREYVIVDLNFQGLYDLKEKNLKSILEITDIIKTAGKENTYFDKQCCSTLDSDTTNSCYEKLISDNRLTGKLKQYLDDGYTATKLYSETLEGEYSTNAIIKSCIKLQKGEEIKVIWSVMQITQKYNISYSYGHYLRAYVNGTAEDVVIEELSFEEFSPTSAIWQEANEKYENAQEPEENQNLQIQDIENIYITTANNKSYKISLPKYEACM